MGIVWNEIGSVSLVARRAILKLAPSTFEAIVRGVSPASDSASVTTPKHAWLFGPTIHMPNRLQQPL